MVRIKFTASFFWWNHQAIFNGISCIPFYLDQDKPRAVAILRRLLTVKCFPQGSGRKKNPLEVSNKKNSWGKTHHQPSSIYHPISGQVTMDTWDHQSLNKPFHGFVVLHRRAYHNLNKKSCDRVQLMICEKDPDPQLAALWLVFFHVYTHTNQKKHHNFPPSENTIFDGISESLPIFQVKETMNLALKKTLGWFPAVLAVT